MGEIITTETLPVLIKPGRSVNGVVVHGLAFADLTPREYYVLADLMYADSDALPRFLATRRSHKNVFSGTFEFIWWGLLEPFRAYSYLRKEIGGRETVEKTETSPEMSVEMLKKLVEMANGGKPAANDGKPIETKAA